MREASRGGGEAERAARKAQEVAATAAASVEPGLAGAVVRTKEPPHWLERRPKALSP